jgi:tripartite-type tricarboxylate transporter receptor subunit TctC
MVTRRQLCAGAAAAATLGASGIARAQQLPQTIRIIVVVPPGASMDNVARLVADKLKDNLKRTVVVEYKPGGTGLVASQFLKTTDTEASYVMFAPIAVAAFFPFLYSKLPYDPDKDLVPVCDGVRIPHALCVNAGSPVQTLQQFLAAAKADPLKASVGTSSMGSVGALLILRLRQLTGIDLQLVAYKGGQPLLTDVLGNQVPAGVSVISDYLAQHKAGKVRIIAAGSPQRTALAPEIPTFVESTGYADLHGASSIGFFVRGGTPQPLVQQLSTEINNVLQQQDVRARLLQMGAEPTGGTAEEFRRLAVSERARWEPVARAGNIKID